MPNGVGPAVMLMMGERGSGKTTALTQSYGAALRNRMWCRGIMIPDRVVPRRADHLARSALESILGLARPQEVGEVTFVRLARPALLGPRPRSLDTLRLEWEGFTLLLAETGWPGVFLAVDNAPDLPSITALLDVVASAGGSPLAVRVGITGRPTLWTGADKLALAGWHVESFTDRTWTVDDVHNMLQMTALQGGRRFHEDALQHLGALTHRWPRRDVQQVGKIVFDRATKDEATLITMNQVLPVAAKLRAIPGRHGHRLGG